MDHIILFNPQILQYTYIFKYDMRQCGIYKNFMGRLFHIRRVSNVMLHIIVKTILVKLIIMPNSTL